MEVRSSWEKTQFWIIVCFYIIAFNEMCIIYKQIGNHSDWFLLTGLWPNDTMRSRLGRDDYTPPLPLLCRSHPGRFFYSLPPLP